MLGPVEENTNLGPLLTIFDHPFEELKVLFLGPLSSASLDEYLFLEGSR